MNGRKAAILGLVAAALLAGCQSSGTGPAGPVVIEAADDAAIAAALPKDFTVRGSVSRIDVSDEVIAIHFAGTDKNGFYAVVLSRGRDAMETAFGPGLKRLQGQTIDITGKITLYRGKPEMVLSDAKQVQVEAQPL